MKPLLWVRKNVVLAVAFTAALITCFIVPIDRTYLTYFETKTLMSLFSILSVVSGLKRTHVFEVVSRKMISLFHNERNVILALIFGTFFFDLIVANDMSLITFLPLTYIVLRSTNNKKYLMFTFIMQTIAANMAGMITPHGNPQNLFLYSYFNIPTIEFTQILLPEFFVTAALLFAVTYVKIPGTKLELNQDANIEVNTPKVILYTVLFLLTIASIFRLIPHAVPFAAVAAAVVFYDRKTLLNIDFGLLLTFCMFFIFSGNMARIPQIQLLLSDLVNKNTLLAGILSCQFISNVPTAIFLSRFTSNYHDLLAAVNLGSLGVMISSLASLITFKEYLKHEPGKTLKYLGMYTLINTAFFVLLIAVYLLSGFLLGN
jgi:Na+/H+ antiporter NhaD/arsenite permease-like protein